MRTPEENISLFDAYLKGSLSQDEKSKFEAQLSLDPDFAKEFEWYKLVVLGIQESRKEELKNYIKANAKITYWGNVWGRSWNIASAAIMVLALASYLVVKFYVKPQSETNKEIAQNLDSNSNTNSTLQAPANNESEALKEEEKKLSEAPKIDLKKNDLPTLKESPQEDSEISLADVSEDEITLTPEQKEIPKIGNSNVEKASASKKEEDIKIKSDVLIQNFNINILLISEDESVKTDRPIKVNIWQSPVNFKGYSFNGKEINLFGVEDPKSIEIYSISNEYFLIKDADYFKIENTGGKYKSYQVLDKKTKAYDLIQSLKK